LTKTPQVRTAAAYASTSAKGKKTGNPTIVKMKQELEAMNYRELQKLAKEHGIRANLKKLGIIEALLEKNSSKQNEEKVETWLLPLKRRL